MRAPCSTEMKMAALEVKLRGPYYGRFEPSSSPKQWRWKLEYAKTCLCKILGTSSTDLVVFTSTLRGRWSKMVPKLSEDSQKDLRLAESVRSNPVGVCSRMCISRVSGKLNFMPSKVFFLQVSCTMASTTARFYVLHFSQIPRSGQKIVAEH